MDISRKDAAHIVTLAYAAPRTKQIKAKKYLTVEYADGTWTVSGEVFCEQYDNWEDAVDSATKLIQRGNFEIPDDVIEAAEWVRKRFGEYTEDRILCHSDRQYVILAEWVLSMKGEYGHADY